MSTAHFSPTFARRMHKLGSTVGGLMQTVRFHGRRLRALEERAKAQEAAINDLRRALLHHTNDSATHTYPSK